MNDRELVELFPAVRYSLSRPSLLLRSLRLGSVEAAISDVVRTARVLEPILKSWPVPELPEAGFEDLPVVVDPLLAN
jgi:hypothetical protein